MTHLERYTLWCQKATDKSVLDGLQAMHNNAAAIDNAFFKDLEFGTGGLRGELGAGTNCLNVYTIAKVTQGIALNMKAEGLKSVAVSMDSRNQSDIFSVRVAEIFAANGIKVTLSATCMPTPFLSYMVRQTQSDMGIMITASHNPAQYNGYKVYDADGCQLTDARANNMIGYIEKVDPFSVQSGNIKEYIAQGLVVYANESLTHNYMAEVLAQSVANTQEIQKANLKVLFTPLNGAGYSLIPTVLKKIGITDLHTVPEQSYPDGNFVTCPYPNPEKPEALKLGLELAQKIDADILIATDPDADRIGVSVKTCSGYRNLTGNETGVLITDYLFNRRIQNGTLPKNPVLIKTIVTTELVSKVATCYGAEVRNVLTGFKYIGEMIKTLELAGEVNRYVFGLEESCGYLAGTYVRDKDAVIASMLVAEMAAYYKTIGISLAEKMEELYTKFGTYSHKLVTKEFAGASGNATMKKLLDSLRANAPTHIQDIGVTKTLDYLTQTQLDLPKSNVLSYDLQGGSQLIVRPSGTEPQIKFYLTAAKTPNENKVVFEKLEKFIAERFG